MFTFLLSFIPWAKPIIDIGKSLVEAVLGTRVGCAIAAGLVCWVVADLKATIRYRAEIAAIHEGYKQAEEAANEATREAAKAKALSRSTIDASNRTLVEEVKADAKEQSKKAPSFRTRLNAEFLRKYRAVR